MTWQERWVDTPEWDLAKRLHNLLCRMGHGMDQCWGLSEPYGLNQAVMAHDFRNWLSRTPPLGSVDRAFV